MDTPIHEIICLYYTGMGTLVWEHWYENTGMGTVVWEHWYENTGMGTLVWEQLYGNTRIRGGLVGCVNRVKLPDTRLDTQ